MPGTLKERCANTHIPQLEPYIDDYNSPVFSTNGKLPKLSTSRLSLQKWPLWGHDSHNI